MLWRHRKRQLHTKNESTVREVPAASPKASQEIVPNIPTVSGVAYATILLACFLAEHNLPFALADHLEDL